MDGWVSKMQTYFFWMGRIIKTHFQQQHQKKQKRKKKSKTSPFSSLPWCAPKYLRTTIGLSLRACPDCRCCWLTCGPPAPSVEKRQTNKQKKKNKKKKRVSKCEHKKETNKQTNKQTNKRHKSMCENAKCATYGENGDSQKPCSALVVAAKRGEALLGDTGCSEAWWNSQTTVWVGEVVKNSCNKQSKQTNKQNK